MKYVCAYNDGLTPVGLWQDRNYDAKTGRFTGDDVYPASTLKYALTTFEAFNDMRCRLDVPTEDGGPSVAVYLSDGTEGILPDSEPVYRLTVTKRLAHRATIAS